MFQKRSDYILALLQLLDRLPNRQGKAQEIRILFVEQYRDEIPPQGFESLTNGDLRWDKEIQWCRYDCVQNGLMSSLSTEVWELTKEGR